MILYRTPSGPVLQNNGQCFAIPAAWDDLVNDDGLYERMQLQCTSLEPDDTLAESLQSPLAPIKSQELWAAGVTYRRSRSARIEEATSSGGGDFYDRVYEAQRPEIFLKATPHRVVASGQSMLLRSDSNWIVPEPELVLVITRKASVIGYTVGNDLSCRDIEGENPLYLPQAKTFDRCAALGPGMLISRSFPEAATSIKMQISRHGTCAFEQSTTVGQMKRNPAELVEFLFRHNRHPAGCLLMTGTGIVPPGNFSLQTGDIVEISIEGIGTLVNGFDAGTL